MLQVMECALCLVTRIIVLLMGSFTASKVPASISWRLTVMDARSLSASQMMLGVPERPLGQKLCLSRYKHVSCLSVDGAHALFLFRLRPNFCNHMTRLTLRLRSDNTSKFFYTGYLLYPYFFLLIFSTCFF